MSNDADRLWAGSMPDAYDRLLGPAVFRPFAIDLANRACALRPHRILELAAGTGVLTRELTSTLPSADVVATDLNVAMVESGSRRAPGAAWEQADAQRLPFTEGDFDLVVCQFGVMFFPDKPAAFAEVRRVLQPGGAMLFNTWDTIDTHYFGRELLTSLQRALPSVPTRFLVDVPHGYADPVRVESDLATGGLECESVHTVTLAGTAESAADVAVGFCTGTPVRAEIEGHADLSAAASSVASDMTARLGEGRVSGSMTAHVFQARKRD